MSQKQITVVIVGMGFGKEFIPIYQSHPNIKAVGICTRSKETRDELTAKFNLDPNLVFEHFEDVPKREDVDAHEPEHRQGEGDPADQPPAEDAAGGVRDSRCGDVAGGLERE